MKRSRILLICTIPISLFITMSLSACSLDAQHEIVLSSETAEFIDESFTTISSSRYSSDVSSLDIELTFDEVVSICSDCLHVDILAYGESERDNFAFSYENRQISYYGDYASYIDRFSSLLESVGPIYGLNGEIISDGISPRSDDYVVRMLQVDNITICEYEDEEWARLAYSERVSNIDGIETMDSDSSNGFSCIISGPSEDSLNVTYYCYNCVFYYTYEVDSSNDDYSIYQDLCDSIGLPTSDVMTQIVLGDSGD